MELLQDNQNLVNSIWQCMVFHSNFISEYSKAREFCMVFMDSKINFSAKSQISDVHVKYLAFGVQYNFEVDHFGCTSSLDLQNVEMTLICQGKTGNKDKLRY